LWHVFVWLWHVVVWLWHVVIGLLRRLRILVVRVWVLTKIGFIWHKQFQLLRSFLRATYELHELVVKPRFSKHVLEV
jgi:hypothetical protein